MKYVIIGWLSFYVVAFGFGVYRWRDVDVYLVFLVVTGFMLNVMPLWILSRREVIKAWLSKYQQYYLYTFVALAFIQLSGILIMTSVL